MHGGCWVDCGESEGHFGAACLTRDTMASACDTDIHCDSEFDHGNPNVFPFAVFPSDLLGDLILMTLPGLRGING